MAKGRVGTLHVMLKASTRAFSRGMRRATMITRGFANGVRRMGRGLLNLKGLLVGAVGGVAFTMWIRNTLKSMDAMSKLSDRLKISTEDLRSFQLAAQISGATNEILAKGLMDFSRRLGEAKMGIGEAIRGLDLLGLSGKRLADMDLGSAFKIVADRIAQMTNANDRALAVYTLMGRSGRELTNMLMGGAAALADFRVEAERLGWTFSRLEGRQIEQANDAFNRLRILVGGIGQQIAIQLAPWLQELATRAVETGNVAQTMATRFVDGMRWIARATAHVIDMFVSLKRAVLDATLSIADAMQDFLRRGSFMAGVMSGLGIIPTLSEQTLERLDVFARELKAHRKAIQEELTEIGVSESAINRVNAFFDAVIKRSKEMAKDLPPLFTDPLAGAFPALARVGAGGRSGIATAKELGIVPGQAALPSYVVTNRFAVQDKQLTELEEINAKLARMETQGGGLQ